MVIQVFFIARDADGWLAAHRTLPKRLKNEWISDYDAIYLTDDDLPNLGDKYDKIHLLKFDDPPIKVRLCLSIEQIEIL